jgi:glycerol-3-phosphate acyltransferase PlsY
LLTTYIIVAAVAYLLGSIPFGYILVRIFRGEDVRATGSGNIGATNVARKAPGLGLATLVLDAAKGYAAVWLGFIIFENQHLWLTGAPVANRTEIAAAIAGLFAILGHVFPMWLGFKGGKGVATGVGAFLALAPKAVAVVLFIFAVVVIGSRYVSLGSIVAAAAFPMFAYLLADGQQPRAVLAAMIAASALIILKHHANIRRLLAGTEHRFELKRTRA